MRIAHLSIINPSSITRTISSGLTIHSASSLQPLHFLNWLHHLLVSIVVFIRIVLILTHVIVWMLVEFFDIFFHIYPRAVTLPSLIIGLRSRGCLRVSGADLSSYFPLVNFGDCSVRMFIIFTDYHNHFTHSDILTNTLSLTVVNDSLLLS